MMKYGLVNRKRSKFISYTPIPFAALLGAVISPQGAVIGLVLGFALSCGLDIYWPRWATELTLDDISLAIRKLKETGLDGGSAILIKLDRQRSVRIIKDKFIRRDLTLGVLLRLGPWQDMLGAELQEELTRIAGAPPVTIRKKFMRHLCFFPESDDVNKCLKMVTFIAEKTVGCELDGVLARGILCRDFVWTDRQEADGIKICTYNFKEKDSAGVIKMTTPEGEPTQVGEDQPEP